MTPTDWPHIPSRPCHAAKLLCHLLSSTFWHPNPDLSSANHNLSEITAPLAAAFVHLSLFSTWPYIVLWEFAIWSILDSSPCWLHANTTDTIAIYYLVTVSSLLLFTTHPCHPSSSSCNPLLLTMHTDLPSLTSIVSHQSLLSLPSALISPYTTATLLPSDQSTSAWSSPRSGFDNPRILHVTSLIVINHHLGAVCIPPTPHPTNLFPF